jgi:hypothetical protein
MRSRKALATLVVVVLLFSVVVSMGQAQGPGAEPVNETGIEGVESTLSEAIPIQGRLTDSHGVPLNGSYSMKFSLYERATGGTAVCSDTDWVHVTDGLFTAYIDYCHNNDITGKQLYLGIKVGSDPEMTPRKPIYAVPYARSLRPGAIISSSSGYGLEILSSAGTGKSGSAIYAENTSTGSGIAIWADTHGTDTTLVTRNLGSGPLFKGFGGDGGEDEFRINNNGSIESKADSYIFVPGNMLRQYRSDNGMYSVVLESWWTGDMEVIPGSTGRKIVDLPVPIPGVLYGQNVKIKSVTIYYRCENSDSYIDRTRVYVRTGWNHAHLIIDSETNHTSTSDGAYYILIPSSNNVLNTGYGIVNIRLDLHFASTSHPIWIGGARIRLGHHHLY